VLRSTCVYPNYFREIKVTEFPTSLTDSSAAALAVDEPMDIDCLPPPPLRNITIASKKTGNIDGDEDNYWNNGDKDHHQQQQQQQQQQKEIEIVTTFCCLISAVCLLLMVLWILLIT